MEKEEESDYSSSFYIRSLTPGEYFITGNSELQGYLNAGTNITVNGMLVCVCKRRRSLIIPPPFTYNLPRVGTTIPHSN